LLLLLLSLSLPQSGSLPTLWQPWAGVLRTDAELGLDFAADAAAFTVTPAEPEFNDLQLSLEADAERRQGSRQREWARNGCAIS